MAFRIIPRDEGFFPLFEEAATIAHDCASRLVGMLHSLPPAEAEVDALMAAERKADEVVREVNRRLERSLVTPFDREDIQLLATSLDDVTDEIFAAADLVFLHRVTAELPGLFELADILEQITKSNVALMGLLSSMRGINELVDAIDQLESSADKVFRRVTGELFSGRHDALDILRWKEIVEAIERAIDSVEDAADLVQTISVKHA
jgi:predicted phosphate transport protein (TIGR00153 family)